MSSSDSHAPDEQNGVPSGDVLSPTTDEHGLPPVEPPSGRFIAQLFLIPLLIVVVGVLFLGGAMMLVSERRDPKYFLRNLDSNNEDIRWRAANDLAQVLKRPESLQMASDPAFALDLSDRLRQAWSDLKQAEKNTLERVKKMNDEQAKKREWKKLEAQRNHVLFLISALGDFTIPVGAPLLCEVANEEDPADIKAGTLRRRRAIWALANMGANRKRFDDPKLSNAKKEELIKVLEKEKKSDNERGNRAAKALKYLHHRMKNKTGTDDVSLEVDKCLENCAVAEDVFLRTLVAHALNFWDGPRSEATLVRLAHDNGKGTRLEITEND